MPRKLNEWVLRNEWLILLICAVFLIRIPTWFEPYWYGDEAIYLTIGQAINKGVGLYNGIHDNKPPLLYLMAAISAGDLFWFKFLATIWNGLTIILFAKLAGKLITRKTALAAAVVLFALVTTWPKTEGNIANAELFFLLPTTGAVLLLWRKNLKLLTVFIGGVVIGIAGLFKMPALAEAAVWPLTWLVFGEKQWFKKSLILALGVSLPVILSLLYFQAAGAGKEYLVAAWTQNIPYLSSWKATSEATGIYSLKGRLAILIVMLAIIFGPGKKWGKNATFVAGWLSLTLFAALLSGRPYPHYLLQIAAPAVLALVIMMYDKLPAKVISGGVWLCLGLTIWFFHFYNYPVVGYYQNFWSFATGSKTISEYISWFGSQAKTNYEVAGWVRTLTLPEEKIFVWGDEPMVYALTRRLPVGKYTVKYHIKDFHAEKATMDTLQRERPKVVVDYGFEAELPGFSDWLLNNYTIENSVNGVKIYSRNNGV